MKQQMEGDLAEATELLEEQLQKNKDQELLIESMGQQLKENQEFKAALIEQEMKQKMIEIEGLTSNNPDFKSNDLKISTDNSKSELSESLYNQSRFTKHARFESNKDNMPADLSNMSYHSRQKTAAFATGLILSQKFEDDKGLDESERSNSMEIRIGPPVDPEDQIPNDDNSQFQEEPTNTSQMNNQFGNGFQFGNEERETSIIMDNS